MPTPLPVKMVINFIVTFLNLEYSQELRYRSQTAAQQYTSSLINYFIVSIKDVVIVRIIISSRRIKNPK